MIGYDDAESVAIKTEWAMKQGFRGVFFWQVDADRLPDGTNPLQEASHREWEKAAGKGASRTESAASMISRMTRQGLPAAKTPSGMSRVTTLPAPMTDREPMWTPGQMIAPPPTQTSEPISIGLPDSWVRRSIGVHRVRGGVDLHRRAEQRVSRRSVTRQTSSTTQLKLKKTRSPSRMFEP